MPPGFGQRPGKSPRLPLIAPGHLSTDGRSCCRCSRRRFLLLGIRGGGCWAVWLRRQSRRAPGTVGCGSPRDARHGRTQQRRRLLRETDHQWTHPRTRPRRFQLRDADRNSRFSVRRPVGPCSTSRTLTTLRTCSSPASWGCASSRNQDLDQSWMTSICMRVQDTGDVRPSLFAGTVHPPLA